MFKLTYFVLIVFCFAYSHQVPVDDSGARVKKAADSELVKDEKVNSSLPTGNTVLTDLVRQAMYPVSGGSARHTIGQSFYNWPHFPSGWSVQQYPSQLSNHLQSRNEEELNARTLGLLKGRPQYYSQYQATPQVYTQAYIQPVEYATPYYSGHSGYSGYSGYSPYYRDAAEEEKPRQFLNVASSDIMSPAKPSVYYGSQYLVEKPAFNTLQAMPQMTQSQMMQPMTPMFIRSRPESELMINNFQGRDAVSDSESMNGGSYRILPSTFGYAPLNELRGRSIMIDDKLQMQIPPSYMQERLQHLTPQDIFAQQQQQQYLSRAAEEPKPMNWYGQESSFKNSNQQAPIQDPYISPEDHVYIEPYVMPEHGQSRAAGYPEFEYPTYPNQRQQFRTFLLQNTYNNLNNNAAQLEALVTDLNKERQWINENGMGTQGTAKSNESNLNDLIRGIVSKNFELKSAEEKTELKAENTEMKKDDKILAKDAKKDIATDAKSSDSVVGSMFSGANSGRHI